MKKGKEKTPVFDRSMAKEHEGLYLGTQYQH